MATTWEGTDVFERLTAPDTANTTSVSEPVVAAADLIALGVLTVTG